MWNKNLNISLLLRPRIKFPRQIEVADTALSRKRRISPGMKHYRALVTAGIDFLQVHIIVY